MGDPAEENDPPPESKGFMTKGIQYVKWKKQKKADQQKTLNYLLSAVSEAQCPKRSSGME